jgi:WD40 repeat protein
LLTNGEIINHLGKLKNTINLKNFIVSKIKSSNKFKRMSLVNGEYTLSFEKGGKFAFQNAILNIMKNNNVVAKITAGETNGVKHNVFGWYKNFIVSAGDNGNIKIYNIKGEEIASLEGHMADVNSISLNGDLLISGSRDQSIRIWNLKNLKNEVNKFYNETYISRVMNKYHITRDNVLKQAKKINDTKIYKSREIYPMLNIFVDKNREYVVWTQEGFFTASKNGTQYIGYHINQGANKEAEYISVEALYDTFYRPDLIQKALKGESLQKYAKNINIQKLLQDGLAPDIQILTNITKTKN